MVTPSDDSTHAHPTPPAEEPAASGSPDAPPKRSGDGATDPENPGETGPIEPEAPTAEAVDPDPTDAEVTTGEATDDEPTEGERATVDSEAEVEPDAVEGDAEGADAIEPWFSDPGGKPPTLESEAEVEPDAVDSEGEGEREPLGPPVLPVAPRRSRKAQWALGFLVFLLVGGIFASTTFELDYYAYKPGAMRPIGPLLNVEGAETYPADGDIAFTTVSLNQVNFAELVAGWLDSDVDIHPAEEVLQDRSPDENRRFNMALMTTAQQVATEVGLTKLGYQIEGIDGYTVIEVQEGSAAEGKLEPGDTIVGVDGERIDDPGDRDRLLAGNAPGEELTLAVRPFTETEEKEVKIQLGAAEDDPNRGVMGVLIERIGVRFPVDVTFDTGKVGGPSAGLAMTLSLLDAMTPGDLTGGKDVAVTGTIDLAGNVGPIGGAGQKAAAVRSAGGDVFLVPSADYESARKRAGDVEVIRVDTLDDALRALESIGGDPVELPPAPETPPPSTP